MRIATTAVAMAAGLMLATAAQAADDFYLGAEIGGSFIEDSDATGTSSTASATGDVEFDPGLMGGLALGYRFGESIRVEGQVTYRGADVDQVNIDGLGSLTGAGDATALGIMANAYYDFSFGNWLKPYVGIGAGGLLIDVDSDSGAFLVVDDSDFVPGWNAMAGLAARIDPQADIYLGYRYIAAFDDPEFDGSVPALGLTGTIEAEVAAHEIMIGVRGYF